MTETSPACAVALGFLASRSTRGNGGAPSTETLACAIGHGHRAVRRGHRATSSAKSSICASTITSEPAGIAAYLDRFHSIAIAVFSVHRILTRHGMPRLPANQKHRPHGKRWQRYEKPQPGHRLQLDVKFLERIPGTRRRLYQFTAIDDCTRIRVLKVYDACNQRTATRFIDEVLRRLPFRVHVAQTDNGLS
jgi:hypothetical protein